MRVDEILQADGRKALRVLMVCWLAPVVVGAGLPSSSANVRLRHMVQSVAAILGNPLAFHPSSSEHEQQRAAAFMPSCCVGDH